VTALSTRPLIPSPRRSVEDVPLSSRAVAYQRVLHQAVRREFRSLAELTRWAPPDDPGRIAQLTYHAELLSHVLLQHHGTERELLWPALLRGLPAREQAYARAAVSSWTGRAATLEQTLRDLSTVGREWAGVATPSARDAFARACTRLADAVHGHLAAEERELHPLLARYLTETEWTAITRTATTSLTGREQLLFLGIALEDACAIDRARVLAGLPPATRTAWRVVGRREHRAYVVRLRGEPPAA